MSDAEKNLPTVLLSQEVQELRAYFADTEQRLHRIDAGPKDIAQFLPEFAYRSLSPALKRKYPSTIIEALKEELADRHIIEVTVAFSPSRTFMEYMRDWFAELLDSPAELSIITDPDIVAGAVIGIEGKLHDHSLREAIQSNE